VFKGLRRGPLLYYRIYSWRHLER